MVILFIAHVVILFILHMVILSTLHIVTIITRHLTLTHLRFLFSSLTTLRQHSLNRHSQVLRRLADRRTQRVLVRPTDKHLVRERGAAEQRKPHLARETVRKVLCGRNGLRKNAHCLQHRGNGVAAKVLSVRLLCLETTATLRLKGLLETRELESDALLIMDKEGGCERVCHCGAQRFLM